jgi:pimeloyl-ACP methyl ester carboxylesterase
MTRYSGQKYFLSHGIDNMDNYSDCWYQSSDGLRLYARDYHCRDLDKPEPATVLCMHGLTRNSADFSDLADHLCERYRVIAVDQRGRGRSEYDSVVANYTPQTYVQDMFTLLDQVAVTEAILVGTSLGGLMSFLMAAMQPQRVLAMIINDIGPELDPRGLDRIKGYAGKTAPVRNWDEALAQTKAINEVAFPDFSDEQWLDFCHGVYREENGVPVSAYDPAIALPLADEESGALPPDLWPIFESSREIPMLVLRGADSDILSQGCVEDMRARRTQLEVAEIPHRGHAPTLAEAASMKAIDGFLHEFSQQYYPDVQSR